MRYVWKRAFRTYLHSHTQNDICILLYRVGSVLAIRFGKAIEESIGSGVSRYD
jgi:hypothetical protein